VRYFYDTEFYEDGTQIHLLSIGIVADDGRELYLENANFDWLTVPKDHWIQENVRPWLYQDDYAHTSTRGRIAEHVANFITSTTDNELWGFYSAYDHVVLAQLFGRMVDMPDGIPWFTNDLKQESLRLGINPDSVLQDGVQHHALSDARWNKKLYNVLQKRDRLKPWEKALGR
jgi:hypothetical protein